jgi:multicomponent Na+:H+ antiporter subunit D
MESILAVLPVLIPLAGAAVAMLLRRRRRAQESWALGVMVLALGSSCALLWVVWHEETALVYAMGGWQPPFGIVMVGDALSAIMVVMSQLVLCAALLYAMGCKDQCTYYPMFYPVFLALGTGLSGALLTGDVFNLFVFVELMVISGAVLTAISDDKLGTEAAFKYFYISMLAAVFLLLACGCLYASYGTLNMADLSVRIMADPSAPLLPVAVVSLLVVFMIKSAVVPFHFWQPDFHTAAPTPVHAVLSSVVVKLGVYGFLRMNYLLFPMYMEQVQGALIVLGVVGVFFGGLGAAGTYDVKRMLAYSTMAQIGFIVVAIGWGTPLALMAAIVYAFNHSLIKAAMLMLAGTVASRAPVKTAAFSMVTGLGRSFPMTGALFLLGGMALAGIPPTNGFVSKMAVFQGGVEAEQLGSLGLIAVGGIITLVYVSRAFSRIWWEAPREGIRPKAYGDRVTAPALLIGLCLLLGLWAEPLLKLAGMTTQSLQDPQAYINAVMVGTHDDTPEPDHTASVGVPGDHREPVTE